MDKQKQIEEMAKDIHRAGKVACDFLHEETKQVLKVKGKFKSTEHTKTLNDVVAEELYNAGYRKIPEGAVVLTREEYEKLKQYEEKVKSGACFTQKEWLELCDEECKRNTENLSKARQLERKETAEKFAEEVDKWKRKAIHYYNLAKSTGVYCIVDDDEICKEISEGE